MFQTGGGGFDLPMTGNPIQALIMLLVLIALIWLAFKIFS